MAHRHGRSWTRAIWPATSSSPPRWPTPGRTMPCSRRKGWKTPAASAQIGCGSSIHSTARVSSASMDATTGPCTSRCGRRITSPPEPSAFRRSTSSSAPTRLRCYRNRTGRGRGSSRRAPAIRTVAVVVANALDADAVRLGSAGAKAMAVVMGEADIYVHDGGMYQWDSAAPAAVALAAGLARQPHRRVTDGVQRTRSMAARSVDLPAGVRRAGAGGAARTPVRPGAESSSRSRNRSRLLVQSPHDSCRAE